MAIVTKSAISDICIDGTTWNGMQPVRSWHKKDLGQYCVYNIFSLKNIILQIPNATKSFILVVNKVSQIWLCFRNTFHYNFQLK